MFWWEDVGFMVKAEELDCPGSVMFAPFLLPGGLLAEAQHNLSSFYGLFVNGDVTQLCSRTAMQCMV